MAPCLERRSNFGDSLFREALSNLERCQHRVLLPAAVCRSVDKCSGKALRLLPFAHVRKVLDGSNWKTPPKNSCKPKRCPLRSGKKYFQLHGAPSLERCLIELSRTRAVLTNSSGQKSGRICWNSALRPTDFSWCILYRNACTTQVYRAVLSVISYIFPIED